MMNRTRHSTLKFLSFFAVIASVFLAVPAGFAQDDDDNERRRSSQPSLSQTVALAVQDAINIANEEPANYRGAIARLNKLISDRGDRLKGYDKATVYEVMGSFKIQVDDIPGALRDLQTAVNTGGLPLERANTQRYYIAQLHFQLENFDAAIAGLREWLSLTEESPPAYAYYLLALAYVQKEDYRSAQQPMEQALQLTDDDPDKNHYNILNLIYSENNERGKRADLLEQMINIWPTEVSYWQQLAGAYANNERDREAFSVLEVAYRSGLLTKEAEIVQLIQYYSFFENAYRGAKLLDREMNAGTVERSRDNLILLSQLWDQSREPGNAIPILQEASRNSQSGELHFRLGRVLVADEQFVDAEKELLTAIRKGGLKQKDIADVWMLLGNARFSQAAAADVRQWNRAKEAFQNATRYPTSRRDATRWVSYINELIRVKILQDESEIAEKKLLCDNAVERLVDARRVLQLQGRPLDDLSPALANDLRDCGFDKEGNPISGSAAAADEASEEGAGEGEE